VINGDIQIVFILDGFNEYAFAATGAEITRVIEEIRWLRGTKNIKVVVSSRNIKQFEDERHIPNKKKILTRLN